MASNHPEIRRLLRLMKRPHALDREPLAIMLREALRTDTSREAVLKTIESAFDVGMANGRLLREIVQRCDLDGDKTRTVAASIGMSARHFFRYRNDAIETVAQAVSRKLRQPDDAARKQLVMASLVAEFDPRAALDLYVRAAPSPTGKTAFEIARAAIWAGIDATPYIDRCKGAWRLLAQAHMARRLLSVGRRAESESLTDLIRAALPRSTGEPHDAVAFEIAELDRRAVRRRGLMDRDAELVERMRVLATGDPQLEALALLAEAEAGCSAGALNAAAVAIAEAERYAVERRDLYALSRATFASASLSALKGDFEDARALFNAAMTTIAAFDAGYALRSAAFAGRCALQTGAAWSPPHALMERYDASWTLVELDSIEARRAIGADPARAVALAKSALRRAESNDATIATLFARATLAAALDRSGDDVQAKRLWLECWFEATTMNDHTALFDLFVIPGAVRRDFGPLALDDAFMDALRRLNEGRFSQLFAPLAEGTIAALFSLLRSALAATMGGANSHARTRSGARPAASGLAGAKTMRDHLMHLGHSISRASAESVGWLLPAAERTSFRTAFVTSWDRLFLATSARSLS